MRLTCLGLILSLLVVTACKKSDFAGSNTAPAGPPSTPGVSPNQNQNSRVNAASDGANKTGACGLLSSSDIQSVQGEAVVDTKLSTTSEGGLNISQCFFTLPTFVNSISLSVTKRGGGKDARDPKAVWKETFGEEGRDRDKKKEGRSTEAEDEERAGSRQRVPGLGQEAFWMGGRVGGALYVLKGDSFFRISIGGYGDQASKLTKSKALAGKILNKI